MVNNTGTVFSSDISIVYNTECPVFKLQRHQIYEFIVQASETTDLFGEILE